MTTTLPTAIEFDKEYTIYGSWSTIPHYGFIERSVTIVKFFQRDYYGKGEVRTYVQTVKRIDSKRPGADEICYGNKFGGMQTADPATVAEYMKMVQK